MRGSEVIANEIRIGYLTSGEGDGKGDAGVIYIHGNFCTPWMWRSCLPALGTQRRHALAIDYLAGSQRPRGGWTVSGLADMVRDLMDAVGLERATIVGHSFGGITAQVFALRFPTRTRALVLVATGATMLGHGSYDDLVRATARGPLSRAQLAEVYRGFWARRPLDEVIENDVDHLARVPHQAFHEALTSAATYDLGRQLGGITAPTLVCHGRHDRGRKVDHARQLHQGIPNSRLQMFDSGHLVPLEAADAFNDAIVAFVEDIDR